jgi:hypothetical protein
MCPLSREKLSAERTALVAVKTALDLSNKLTSWSNTTCQCSWAGVTCTNGSVTNV